MDHQVFQDQYEIFKDRVRRKSGRPFVSFQEGLPQEWEGYKEPNRQRALTILDPPSWQKSHIGNGAILERLIAAVELPKISEAQPANNLVSWHEGYGHQSRSHHRLIDAREDPGLRRHIEAWAYGFYREGIEASDAFDRLREIAGARYDLLAYMMFLRDSSRFMPLKVQTFDAALAALGFDLRMSGHCSWDNYVAYLEALGSVRGELASASGLSGIGLLDAHSFCWLLVRREMEPADALFIASAKGKASNARKLDAVERSVFDMAFQAAETAASSNGQQVSVVKKNKELLIKQEELRDIIRECLLRQRYECALTGILLQFRGEHTDSARLASLDRIDSSRHYEPGNLQIVCRFVNRWKSDTPDTEFRRLLDMIRSPVDVT